MTMLVRIQLLVLEHCCSISTGSYLTTLLTALTSLPATITCIPIYLENWLGSQRFNNNVLMEGVKTWLSSQEADFFEAGM
jgi:hypothetical protein